MAAPAPVKSWYDLSYSSVLLGTNQLTNCQKILYRIAFQVVSYTWGVGGSSDSSTADMSSNNRWTDPSNLVWASAGSAHSWIVLTNSTISSNFAMCIDLSNSNSKYITIVISPVNGFGTAHGGTNGTTTNRPTATDEIVIVNNDTWADINGAGFNTSGYYLNACQSTDGECTYIFVSTSLTNAKTPVMAFFIAKPQNPISSWTTPWVVGIKSSNTSGSTIFGTNWNDNAWLYFKPNNTSKLCTMFMDTTFIGTQSYAEYANQIKPNKVNNKFAFYPITLTSDDIGVKGIWGSMFDLYFVDSGFARGDTDSDYLKWMFVDNMCFYLNGGTWR